MNTAFYELHAGLEIPDGTLDDRTKTLRKLSDEIRGLRKISDEEFRKKLLRNKAALKAVVDRK